MISSRANPLSARTMMRTLRPKRLRMAQRIFSSASHRAAAGIALGVSQSRQERDIATKAVEWQITVAAVVTVEESSFLVARQRVVGGVKIQDNLPALSRDRLNSFFD